MFWNKICKHNQARGMLRYYNKKNTDKAKSCLGLKLRNFTIESIQTKAKLCSKYMCQFEAYKSRMLSTSNQGSSDLTRQIVGRPVTAWIFAPPTCWKLTKATWIKGPKNSLKPVLFFSFKAILNWWIFIKLSNGEIPKIFTFFSSLLLLLIFNTTFTLMKLIENIIRKS